MTQADESAALQLRITADLLAQGRAINLLSSLCSAIAFGFLLNALMRGLPTIFVTGLVLSLLLGLTEAWLALRTGFDARLFRRLAAGPDGLAEFDGAMLMLALMPPEKAGRPIAARIAGARRLLALQGLTTILQIAIGVVAALLAGQMA